MDIKFHSLLIATGIGFTVQVILIVITDIPLIATASSEVTINPASIVISCLSSIIGIASPIITGMIYPLLASQKTSLTRQSGIIGGAISVILASILGTLFLLSFRWLIIPLILNQINPTISFETVKQILGMSAFGGAGLFFIFIGGWIMNGVIGAIGGAIGIFWVNRRKK